MHLISIVDLSLKTIETIFENADQFKKKPWQQSVLNQKIIANLFFENSTRTRCSFELAAKRLGATVLNLDLQTSSTQKGETVLDTVHNLEAMGVDAFIVRHQEDRICSDLAVRLKSGAKIINAGTGTGSHPSQALLDAYTIRQFKNDFSSLRIAIVGDIRHSRVAASNIECLRLLGVKDIRVIGPRSFLPDTDLNVSCFTSLHEGLLDADVVMVLRIQKERMGAADMPDMQNYINTCQLNTDNLRIAKKDVLVMHPGPMNRGLEITDAVADGKQSVILQQAENGIFIRQAILKLCLT